MLQIFSGWQYLLIDVANQYGLDKLLFDQRIKWVEDHLDILERLAVDSETPALYIKAVMAVRKAQAGLPTGHLMGMDAVCSGIQVMSALTGCVVGATNTGLVDPSVRADAYTTCTKLMQDELGTQFTVSRSDAKDALMTTMYGSKAKPKEIFGEDTPELNAFYKAVAKVAPGAYMLLQDLLDTWKPHALFHSWKLPDGFDSVVKVMQKQTNRVEVDELDHSTFTYEYYTNEGSKSGLSNVANVVHSVDAYILRSMHRRCNYNKAHVLNAKVLIGNTLSMREAGICIDITEQGSKLEYYHEQYRRSGMVDAAILPYITSANIDQLSTEYLTKLDVLVRSMLVHNPFELVTIHDEFKCSPNNMNYLRQHYIDIFAEIAESNLLDDLMSQLHGVPGHVNKLSSNLGSLIRNSNYALS